MHTHAEKSQNAKPHKGQVFISQISSSRLTLVESPLWCYCCPDWKPFVPFRRMSKSKLVKSSVPHSSPHVPALPWGSPFACSIPSSSIFSLLIISMSPPQMELITSSREQLQDFTMHHDTSSWQLSHCTIYLFIYVTMSPTGLWTSLTVGSGSTGEKVRFQWVFRSENSQLVERSH